MAGFPRGCSMAVLGLGVAIAMAAVAACAHTEPRDADASSKRLALGQEYFGKHLIPAALIEIQHAIDLDPENPEAYYTMGLLKMGQAVEHLELGQRATCLHGAAADAERVDAGAKMHEAETLLEKAIAYRPNYAEAFDAMAVVAIFKKDFDAAVRDELKAQENAVFA